MLIGERVDDLLAGLGKGRRYVLFFCFGLRVEGEKSWPKRERGKEKKKTFLVISFDGFLYGVSPTIIM